MAESDLTSFPKVKESFQVSGRTAIVTGGSRGIGLAIAKTLAAEGSNVVIASRKAENCEAVAEHINSSPEYLGEALPVATHMGELDQLQILAAKTVEHFGAIDILVNNAANALAMDFDEMTEAAWDKSFAVNLKGPVFLVQYCLPQLIASQHASIVNISSAAGFIFAGFTHMYAAAKAGLQSYTRSLAVELASHKIRVNCIAPGTVNTDMVRSNSPEAQASMAEASIMARAAHPDEIASLALFLASDASSFMTGATVNIDGGMVAR